MSAAPVQRADRNEPNDHLGMGWERNRVGIPRTARQSMSFDSTASESFVSDSGRIAPEDLRHRAQLSQRPTEHESHYPLLVQGTRIQHICLVRIAHTIHVLENYTFQKANIKTPAENMNGGYASWRSAFIFWH